MRVSKKTTFMVQFSILLAIEAIFCFTPLGSLPAFGPIVMTTAMLPVVITAIMLGTAAGSLMGAFAGLFSFIVWTFMTPPLSLPVAFVFTPIYPPGNFWSLVICFVPRILVGTVAGLVFAALKKLPPKADWLRYVLAGLLGSLANTVGVLGGVWLFFGDAYAGVLGTAIHVIIGLSVLTSGLPEAALSAVVAVLVCKPLKKALSKRPAA